MIADPGAGNLARRSVDLSIAELQSTIGAAIKNGTIGRGGPLRRKLLARPEPEHGLESWISSLSRAVAGDATHDGAIERCTEPETLLDQLRFRTMAGPGVWYLGPVLLAWIVLLVVEIAYSQADSPDSLFTWWTRSGFPFGLGPGGLSAAIILAVVVVMIVAWYEPHFERKGTEDRARIRAAIHHVCGQALTFDKDRQLTSIPTLENTVSELRRTILAAVETRLPAVVTDFERVAATLNRAAAQYSHGADMALSAAGTWRSEVATFVTSADAVSAASTVLADGLEITRSQVVDLVAASHSLRGLGVLSDRIARQTAELTTQFTESSASAAANLSSRTDEAAVTVERSIEAMAERVRGATAEAQGALGVSAHEFTTRLNSALDAWLGKLHELRQEATHLRDLTDEMRQLQEGQAAVLSGTANLVAETQSSQQAILEAQRSIQDLTEHAAHLIAMADDPDEPRRG